MHTAFWCSRLTVGRRRGACLVAVVVLAASLAGRANPASADQNETPAMSSGRVLFDHLFLPSDLVRDPFTATYFDIRTTWGYATGSGPLFDVNGQTLGGHDYR